jgi:hypothetical protein
LAAEKSYETDRTSATNDDWVTKADVCTVHSCEGHGERLKHGAVLESHAVGELVAPHCWMLEVTTQKTGDGRSGEELYALAAVVATCKARLAFTTDDVGFDGYTVARLEVCY